MAGEQLQTTEILQQMKLTYQFSLLVNLSHRHFVFKQTLVMNVKSLRKVHVSKSLTKTWLFQNIQSVFSYHFACKDFMYRGHL